MTNTRIAYEYSDAEGRKTSRSVVLAGDIAGELLATLNARGNYDILMGENPAFIPGQLGLPDAHDHFEMGRDWDFTIDHPWQYLEAVESTDQHVTAPTIKASEVLRKAQTVEWDNNHTPWFKDFLDARMNMLEEAKHGKWAVIDENIDGWSRYVLMRAKPEIVTIYPENDGVVRVVMADLMFDDGSLEDWLDTIECDLFSDCINRSDGAKLYGEEAIKLMIEAAIECDAHGDEVISEFSIDEIRASGLEPHEFVSAKILHPDTSTETEMSLSL